MVFEVSGVDGNARAGVANTHHGDFETPAFMPCGTVGAVKAVRWAELEDLGYNLILVNSLHLHLRPGADVVSESGGIHAFTGWNGPILTDSGGYQFFSLKGLYRINDEGVEFQSPYDGGTHRFTPERVIDIQTALGSDIIMPLDECPPGNASRADIARATQRTYNWLERARDHFRKRGSSSQALFGIIQGGVHPDLRREYMVRSAKLDLPGYALGGISVGEDPEEGDRIVTECAPLLPPGKPRYLMGVGLPRQILDAIAAGVDMFDCVLPTRMGRNGTVFTSQGRMNLGNARFKDDPAPLDPACSCPTCRRHSRAYLAHLHRIHEPGVLGLLSLHNLAYYRKLVSEARDAILNARFARWRAETENAWLDREEL